MTTSSSTTRQRLVQSALELFLSQGIHNTPTRQVANLAGVNEVTLFRHFGNKYGLLKAVIEESSVFRNLGEALIHQASPTDNVRQSLKAYASNCLHALEQAPDFVRSVIGEADQYPLESRQALGQRLTEANRYVAQYLDTVMPQDAIASEFPPEKLASFFSGLLIGYIVIESVSETHHLWSSREDFLETLVGLLLRGGESSLAVGAPERVLLAKPASMPLIVDIPASWVHQILQQARVTGIQDYALAYVFFAAGLSATEIASLQKVHHQSDKSQHSLRLLSADGFRQVPINQWVLGKRYGNYVNNPLTKWLKSRKDNNSAMFLDDQGAPITAAAIHQHWQLWVNALPSLTAEPPLPTQAKQTWCIEMLMRGMSVEDLSILSGWPVEQLQPYARRAREKAALDAATQLDRKLHSSS